MLMYCALILSYIILFYNWVLLNLTTQGAIPTMSNKPMKLHTQKGKRRLWLEEQKYGLPGFKPG